MKSKQITLLQIALGAIVLAGVGGVISGACPVTGAILTAIGAFGSLFDRWRSDGKAREDEDIREIQAKLLARAGLGNVHTEAAGSELQRRRMQNAFEQSQKGLTLDPNDERALAYFGALLAVQLSFQQWLGKDHNPGFESHLRSAESCAEKGLRINPRNAIFHDILGIAADIRGDHEKARAEFLKSGKLNKDPGWRLQMATSWGMSNRHREELAEVVKAKEEGEKSWDADFYHARALESLGRLDEAIAELTKANACRRWKPEILELFSACYFRKDMFLRATRFQTLCAFSLLRYSAYHDAWRRLQRAAFLLFFGATTKTSRSIWSITRHIPKLREVHIRWSTPAEPHYTLGNVAYRLSRLELAEYHYRNACRITPNAPDVLGNLFGAIAMQGRYAESLPFCKQAIAFATEGKMLDQLKKDKQYVEGACQEIGGAQPAAVV